MKTYLRHLIQLILSPRNGWEDIEKADVDPSLLLGRGYYPLIAIAALSVYFKAVWTHAAFLQLFFEMIVWFVVFFVGYFFGVFVLSLFVEPMVDGKYDDDRCHTFVAYTLGIEAVIAIICQCLPVTTLVLFFLPCYVALVEWKGVGYMKIKPVKVGLFMILAIFGVLLPPYILYYIFSLMF